ncbi:DUF502 domain-containing protein [Halorhabdus amylolytica]|uniref:DUF502 domain-containing protein n=1 Tax=Halorhabdus amylolytica TaxID=2559573 RepID=UPI0010AAF6DB|nr:DUF502 domain-containing protein [Halorhabdus amylolytica]
MASTWKRDFASGLIVLAPLLVTVIVLLWLYNRLKAVPIAIEPEPLRVAVTIVVFILLVFAVGYLMRTALGALLEDAIDDLMNQLPGLRVVYNASKMAAETALTGTDELQAPVKLETWNGMRMTAFLTGKSTDDGRDVLFLPTAPNITTGFVVEVEPEDYTKTDERVEDALTRILSAGFGESEESVIQVDVEDIADEEDATGTESN